jgi:hypothetical protein
MNTRAGGHSFLPAGTPFSHMLRTGHQLLPTADSEQGLPQLPQRHSR